MRQKFSSFMAGLLTGAALLGGGATYAAGIMAEYAPQAAYVDGVAVQMEAYNIGGYNYVKLRDIGQMVGFNVYWDGHSVRIDSDAPYTGEVPAQADRSIRVSSMNGNTLKVGGSSSLITSPYDLDCTAVSSNDNVVSLEKVLGYWVATAKAPGTAVITVTASDGRAGSVTITVEPVDPAASEVKYPVDLNANLEIRQEIIRLANQVRRENGVPEAAVNNSLMDAAQFISGQRYSWHHTQEECEAARTYGYPYGFGSNLTVFTGAGDVAQRAITNWLNSPGHFQTMIDPRCDCIGVGVTRTENAVYCYMFLGDPNSHTAY